MTKLDEMWAALAAYQPQADAAEKVLRDLYLKAEGLPMIFQFSKDTPQWVMQVTPDRRLEVNEDFTATEAAQKVLGAMQVLLRHPTKWTDAEVSNGCCGIRWVNAEGVQGVPTREDVETYMGYASQPAQRKPLTDEQIEDLYFDKFSMGELKAFARAIEAKLKETNK